MDIYQSLGAQAAIGIFSHILFIGITFYALQSLRIEQFFKKGHTFQIQIFYIILSIAIGTAVSNFLIQFISWSKQLIYLVQ